jgi:hypothetical protein
MDLKRLSGWLAAGIMALVLVAVAVRLWDGEMTEREALHQAQVRSVLATSHTWQARVDSLRVQERAARARGARLADELAAARAELASLRDSFVVEARRASEAPVQGVAEALGLVATGPSQWIVDSAGVRRLEQLRLEADRGRIIIPLLERQVDLMARQITALQEAEAAASARADSAEYRVHVLQPLLEEAEKLRQCRIIGLIRCPSRQLSFLAGAAVATVAILATSSRQ